MLMERERAMAFTYTKTNINIAEIGKVTKKVAKEFLSLKKKENMKVILKMDNEMDLAHFFTRMEMFIKENGKMVKKMDKEYTHFLQTNKDLKDNSVMIIL